MSSWRGEAPSTVAASVTSCGTPSSAAANRIIAKAIPRQMLTTMIASMALSWSQATGAMPASPIARLTVPWSLDSSMLDHAKAATVSGTTSGIRMAAPHRPLSRMSRRWSARAAARPRTNWPMIAEKATKIPVRRMACWKPSLPIRRP